MNLIINQTLSDDAPPAVKVHVMGAQRLRAVSSARDVIIVDGGNPFGHYVALYLTDETWKQLARIVQDRAFASECEAREAAGAL